MKTLIKSLVLIIIALLFLCASCKKEEPTPEPDIIEGIDIFHCYTDYVESITGPCMRIGDSNWDFYAINGWYCQYGFNSNAFTLQLADSMRHHLISFEMPVKPVEPEVFFQKGVQEIDYYIFILPALMCKG